MLFCTCPVGVDGFGPPAPEGIVTMTVVTIAIWLEAALYSVVFPLPWFETQKGLVVLNERPHGSIRLGSVTSASPGTSETKIVLDVGINASLRARDNNW